MSAMTIMTAARVHKYGELMKLEHRIFPMSQVDGAMAALNNRNGGFTPTSAMKKSSSRLRLMF
jgi:hypothetical protein